MANEKWFSEGCSLSLAPSPPRSLLRSLALLAPFLFQVSGISCQWDVIQGVLWLHASPEGSPLWFLIGKKEEEEKDSCCVTLPLNYTHDTHKKPFHSFWIVFEIRPFGTQSPAKINRVHLFSNCPRMTYYYHIYNSLIYEWKRANIQDNNANRLNPNSDCLLCFFFQTLLAPMETLPDVSPIFNSHFTRERLKTLRCSMDPIDHPSEYNTAIKKNTPTEPFQTGFPLTFISGKSISVRLPGSS